MGIERISYERRRKAGQGPADALLGATQDSRQYNKFARRRLIGGTLVAFTLLSATSGIVHLIGRGQDQMTTPAPLAPGFEKPEPLLAQATEACRGSGDSEIVTVNGQAVRCAAVLRSIDPANDTIALGNAVKAAPSN